MPKKPRTTEEINEVKETIIRHALDIINKEGFQGLSMRKLAGRLGVQAVTIYNYFENKDDLYLAILTEGFQMLYDDCVKAYESESDPMERLRAMMHAYLNFGITQANFYNLMFTWHVPKYGDYVGTPMEEAARIELVESQKVLLYFIKAVQELAEPIAPLTENEIRSYIIYAWSTLHGYIAGINNELLNYIHHNPHELKELVLENLFNYIQQELQEKG